MMAGDRNGKSDPYVTIKCGSAPVFKSKVVKATLCPVWDDDKATVTFGKGVRIRLYLIGPLAVSDACCCFCC